MKLGFYFQQGKPGQKSVMHYGPLGKFIQMIRPISLFYPVMKPEFAKEILSELWQDQVFPDLVAGHYFILEVDGMSNTLTICLPVCYSSGTIEMDKDEYEKILLAGEYPNLTISFDNILAFRVLNVRQITARPDDRDTTEEGEELTSEHVAFDSDITAEGDPPK